MRLSLSQIPASKISIPLRNLIVLSKVAALQTHCTLLSVHPGLNQDIGRMSVINVKDGISSESWIHSILQVLYVKAIWPGKSSNRRWNFDKIYIITKNALLGTLAWAGESDSKISGVAVKFPRILEEGMRTKNLGFVALCQNKWQCNSPCLHEPAPGV